MQNILGKNYDLLSVGHNIWKSSDGVTWMLTFDHIKPTIEPTPCITYFAMLNSKRRNTKTQIASMREF